MDYTIMLALAMGKSTWPQTRQNLLNEATRLALHPDSVDRMTVVLDQGERDLRRASVRRLRRQFHEARAFQRLHDALTTLTTLDSGLDEALTGIHLAAAASASDGVPGPVVVLIADVTGFSTHTSRKHAELRQRALVQLANSITKTLARANVRIEEGALSVGHQVVVRLRPPLDLATLLLALPTSVDDAEITDDRGKLLVRAVATFASETDTGGAVIEAQRLLVHPVLQSSALAINPQMTTAFAVTDRLFGLVEGAAHTPPFGLNFQRVVLKQWRKPLIIWVHTRADLEAAEHPLALDLLALSEDPGAPAAVAAMGTAFERVMQALGPPPEGLLIDTGGIAGGGTGGNTR
ncbi:hypothetical protein OG216_19235 [Streptomycetaceae bacterium NBC_01309]